ncbi:hypothetical protein [Paenibacillus agricola]|uniref:DnaA-like protein n=1 Tax=Paenibacillus agricola TaxID=2716264 RepID=A0ABX0JDJ6_9BACL|nr:hypothetical protein [Paenibacillus agricola]NHN33331.1 hypothetical protein [Paenibacillus agricola]
MFINQIIEEARNQNVHKKVKDPLKKERKTRSDKLHDIRFPVTPDERMRLRRIGKHLKLTETACCTHLLMLALQLREQRIPSYPYEDTRRYMHVKPTEEWYKIIAELAIHYDVSERQMVYRLIHFSLEIPFKEDSI